MWTSTQPPQCFLTVIEMVWCVYSYIGLYALQFSDDIISHLNFMLGSTLTVLFLKHPHRVNLLKECYCNAWCLSLTGHVYKVSFSKDSKLQLRLKGLGLLKSLSLHFLNVARVGDSGLWDYPLPKKYWCLPEKNNRCQLWISIQSKDEGSLEVCLQDLADNLWWWWRNRRKQTLKVLLITHGTLCWRLKAPSLTSRIGR